METVRIGRDDPQYPESLRLRLGDDAPTCLESIGNLDLLQRTKLAMFCSAKCPGEVIVRSYDLAQRLRQTGIAALGGFHSPMEREWLAVLLRGPQPVILCPARSIDGMRLPAEYRQPLQEGRLLILSCFVAGPDRPTVEMAVARNRFVAALADAVFVAHAAPGGKMERFCREVASRGRPLYTLASHGNENLLALGAIQVSLHAGSHLPWG